MQWWSSALLIKAKWYTPRYTWYTGARKAGMRWGWCAGLWKMTGQYSELIFSGNVWQLMETLLARALGRNIAGARCCAISTRRKTRYGPTSPIRCTRRSTSNSTMQKFIQLSHCIQLRGNWNCCSWMQSDTLITYRFIGAKAKWGLDDILGLSRGLPTMGTNAEIELLIMVNFHYGDWTIEAR